MTRAAITAGLIALAAAGRAHAQPAHLAPGDEHSESMRGGGPAGSAGGAGGKAPRGIEVARGAIEPEPPEIDLLTFGVGPRIFEKFGHAAICLHYHRPEHPDVCFNYGVTDFRAGAAMVWRFLRGEQRFWVEPTTLDSMLQFYRWEDRDIWRQRLPITGGDARALEARLWSDIREENRYYRYDHFLDNCTTRIRDLIDQATHGALRAGADRPASRTLRELGRRGLAGMASLLVLSDLVVGRALDVYPTQWEAMFHPGIFRVEVAARLRATPVELYQRRGTPFPTHGSSGRLHFLAISVAFALPLFFARMLQRREAAALVLASVGLGLLGSVVWGAAIASTLPALRYNEAMLVVMPFDAALPLLSPDLRRWYARARLAGVAAVAVLAIAGVFQQPLSMLVLAVIVPLATLAFDLPHGRSPRLA